MRNCTIEDCTRELRARGMCATHWARWRKHGDPHRVISYAERTIPAEVRFWAKVEKTAGCWYWRGAIADTGYGIFNTGRRLDNAHRFAYKLTHGSIPAGAQLDHLCRIRRCVRPEHLEPVTGTENIRRAALIGHDHPNAPTQCRRGHDWSVTPPYLAHRSNGRVTRRCRVCQRKLDQQRRSA